MTCQLHHNQQEERQEKELEAEGLEAEVQESLIISQTVLAGNKTITLSIVFIKEYTILLKINKIN